MSAPTFLQTLRHEVGLLQAQYPDRADEVSRACALITMGYVVDQGDGNGKVLSSDGTRYYAVNGQCECRGAQYGRHCKHLSAWKLYKHIERRLAAQTAQEGTEAAGETGVDTAPGPDVPTGLPEAPASVNVRVTIQGREVQLTLRDHDEARLLARLQTVLEQFPVPEAPHKTADSAVSPPRDQPGWCAKHGVPMRQTTKHGRSWFSHHIDGQWCKGR